MPCERENCELCLVHNGYKKVLEILSTSNLSSSDYRTVVDFTTDLLDRWSHESEDADYKGCILDGSWPGSVEILERALDKARSRSVLSLSQENPVQIDINSN